MKFAEYEALIQQREQDNKRLEKLAPAEKALANLIKSRKHDNFPRHNYKQQLEFIARDLLFARRLYLGEVDPEDENKVLIQPNARGLAEIAGRLLRLAEDITKYDHAYRRPKDITPKTDEISDDLIPKQRQAEIDEAIKKNQEAIDAATGLPKHKPGYVWRPSTADDTPGIVRNGAGWKDTRGYAEGLGDSAEENPADAEGVGPPKPVTRID